MTPHLPSSVSVPDVARKRLGKLAFRWIYWNLLLPGRPLPLPAAMSMAGKVAVADVPHSPAPERE